MGEEEEEEEVEGMREEEYIECLYQQSRRRPTLLLPEYLQWEATFSESVQ